MARVIIVSNRVNVPTPNQKVRAGGLEVALNATLKKHAGIWLGWSGEVKPKEQVRTRTIEHGHTAYIVADLSKEDYEEYYSGFANRVLWPILHYRLDMAEFSRRDLTGYLRVNQHFADEAHKFLKPDDVIWVHDYHLIPFARALRERGHRNKIGFFLHIPFPPADILTALPNHERLIPDLLHYDLVGFQTDNDGGNFARYLSTERGIHARVHRMFEGPGRNMRIGTFPVGIETEQFARQARRAAVSDLVRKVVQSLPGDMVIGVDRLDYSKGLNLRLEGYERFLVSRPDYRGRVTYLQITPRSRSNIAEYANLERELDTAAGRINGTYGEVAWTPIRYINKAYSRTALSGLYRAARVGLVTPLRDGMNLVAKEYVAAQNPEDPGVLILSRFAGTAAEFGNAALLINPYDPDTVGGAIARALEMPMEERRHRHRQLYEALLRNDISSWGERFLMALAPEQFGGQDVAVPPRTSSLH